MIDLHKDWPVVSSCIIGGLFVTRLVVKDAVRAALKEYRTKNECKLLMSMTRKDIHEMKENQKGFAKWAAMRLGELAQKAQIILGRRELKEINPNVQE